MNIVKNRFLNFIISFLPGAGHMYQGMMRKGAVLMLSFFGIIAVGSLLYIDPIYFLLPVVWCYSFFDSMNTIHLTHGQRLQLDYQFGRSMLSRLRKNEDHEGNRLPAGLGWLCVGLGIYLGIMNFIVPVLHSFISIPWLESTLRKLPTLLVCLGVILFGFFLLGAKSRMQQDELGDDYVEYQGDDNDLQK